jgi:hypothetical protein
MINPNQVVWLTHSYSQVAHSLNGKLTSTSWSTACGQSIQVSTITGVHENGSLVAWKLLNHNEVRLCRHCFTKDEQNAVETHPSSW